MIDDYQKENLGNKYVYLVLYVTVDSLGFARQRLFRRNMLSSVWGVP